MSEPSLQYTVLARRFRPQSFADVVGQEHVGQAIQNAIRTGRVAHAYLFTGARGVGKTSTARIFAKALNCPNLQDGVPCNQCDICLGIGAGNDVDVLEIDGASNRGIDDIRQLRANVSVRSMRSPNKVYIIDEVHMLTKEAFNALLKTLEEPPPNVKFVFCTTEPNKVPDTILSRCQRFDFGTIAQESIAGRLKQIAESEGKQVDDAAVELVARRAAGSMRDSQSLFDQLLAFGGEHITADDVHRLLGTATDDRLIDLVDSLIRNEPATALAMIDTALQEGVQIGSFSDQLLAYLRDLLVIAAGATGVSLSAVTENSRQAVLTQAKRWGLQTISAAMQILAETKQKMQRVNYARALMELAIVRMASLEQLDQIAALLLQAGTGGAKVAQPIVPRSRLEAADEVKKNSEVRQNLAAPGVEQADPEPEPIETGSSAIALVDHPPVVEPTPSRSAVEGAVSDVTTQGDSSVEFTEKSLVEFWEKLLSQVPEKLADHMKNASNTAIFGPNRLEIFFPKSYAFSKSYCETPESVKKLISVAESLAGKPVDIRFQIDATAVAATQATPRPAKPKSLERQKPSVVDGDAFVQMAAHIFNGQVVEVRPLMTEVVPSEAEDSAVEAEAEDFETQE